MEQDSNVLQSYRKKRVDHISEYAGSEWSDNVKCDNPVNVLSLFINVISRYLVGNDPRAMMSTFDPAIRPLAEVAEDWTNRQLVKFDFGEILKKAVVDSLFQMGIIKVSITAPAEARFGGYGRKAGEVGIWNVDPEDFLFDTRARCFEECSYQAHRIRVCLDDVQNSSLFAKKPRMRLVPKDDQDYNPNGDEKVKSLGSSAYTDDFEEYVELWEVFLPRYGKVVTFGVDDDPAEPLLIQDWIGPECGPFIVLGLGDVPGNIVPKAPVTDLVKLSTAYNTLWKKLSNAASEQKSLILYQNEDDAKAIQGAAQGDYVRCSNPSGIVPVNIGGVDQNVTLFAQMTGDLFSKHAGNLETLAGLGQQAGTATQEELIHSSASQIAQNLAGKVTKYAHKVIANLSWFHWHNPHQVMKSTYAAPGVPEYQIQRQITPQDRSQHDFDEIDVRIDPYSLPYQTPQDKLTTIRSLMQNVLIPMAPMFHQPGIADMLDAYLRMEAKYTNTPEIIQLLEKVSMVEGQQEPDTASAEDQGMQPETTRNYVRTSRSAMTDKGQQQVLQQLMAGGQTNQGKGMEAMAG